MHNLFVMQKSVKNPTLLFREKVEPAKHVKSVRSFAKYFFPNVTKFQKNLIQMKGSRIKGAKSVKKVLIIMQNSLLAPSIEIEIQ